LTGGSERLSGVASQRREKTTNEVRGISPAHQITATNRGGAGGGTLESLLWDPTWDSRSAITQEGGKRGEKKTKGKVTQERKRENEREREREKKRERETLFV